MENFVLLTWVGFHDPFGGEPTKGIEDGPVLTVVAERQPRSVHLFANPGVSRHVEATSKELAQRVPDTSVTVHRLPLVDPTDLNSLWGLVRAEVDRITSK
jgi:hypothetical protein